MAYYLIFSLLQTPCASRDFFDLNYTEISLLLVLQYFAQEMLILSVHLQKEHNPSLDPIVLNIVETAYVFHRAAFYQNVYLYLV